MLEVRVVDRRDVPAAEDADLELLSRRVAGRECGTGSLEIGQGLINNVVGADDFGDGVGVPVVGDQLGRRGEVDAVDVGVRDGRRARREVDLLRAGLARHQHDLARRRAAHNAVVDQQHVLALELLTHGVQLGSHAFLPQPLRRHDEGAEDVPVLHEPLAVRFGEAFGHAKRRRNARFRDRHDDVDGSQGRGAQLLSNGFGELETHVATRFVDVNTIDNRVGTGEVHVLEDIRRVAELRVHLVEDGRFTLFDNNCLARQDVEEIFVSALDKGNGFGGHHVVGS